MESPQFWRQLAVIEENFLEQLFVLETTAVAAPMRLAFENFVSKLKGLRVFVQDAVRPLRARNNDNVISTWLCPSRDRDFTSLHIQCHRELAALASSSVDLKPHEKVFRTHAERLLDFYKALPPTLVDAFVLETIKVLERLSLLLRHNVVYCSQMSFASVYSVSVGYLGTRTVETPITPKKSAGLIVGLQGAVDKLPYELFNMEQQPQPTSFPLYPSTLLRVISRPSSSADDLTITIEGLNIKISAPRCCCFLVCFHTGEEGVIRCFVLGDSDRSRVLEWKQQIAAVLQKTIVHRKCKPKWAASVDLSNLTSAASIAPLMTYFTKTPSHSASVDPTAENLLPIHVILDRHTPLSPAERLTLVSLVLSTKDEFVRQEQLVWLDAEGNSPLTRLLELVRHLWQDPAAEKLFAAVLQLDRSASTSAIDSLLLANVAPSTGRSLVHELCVSSTAASRPADLFVLQTLSSACSAGTFRSLTDRIDRSGQTPLHALICACERNEAPLTRDLFAMFELVVSPCAVNARDSAGCLPMDLLVRCEHLADVGPLLAEHLRSAIPFSSAKLLPLAHKHALGRVLRSPLYHTGCFAEFEEGLARVTFSTELQLPSCLEQLQAAGFSLVRIHPDRVTVDVLGDPAAVRTLAKTVDGVQKAHRLALDTRNADPRLFAIWTLSASIIE